MRYEVSEMLGWSGLWAADSARSPPRSATSRSTLRSAHMLWFKEANRNRRMAPSGDYVWKLTNSLLRYMYIEIV